MTYVTKDKVDSRLGVPNKLPGVCKPDRSPSFCKLKEERRRKINYWTSTRFVNIQQILQMQHKGTYSPPFNSQKQNKTKQNEGEMGKDILRQDVERAKAMY